MNLGFVNLHCVGLYVSTGTIEFGIFSIYFGDFGYVAWGVLNLKNKENTCQLDSRPEFYF